MLDSPHVWAEAAGSAVSFLVGGLLAWLLASLSKVSKKSLQEQFAERDKLIFQPIRDELAELKGQHKEFVTRAELRIMQESILARLDDLATSFQACMARGDRSDPTPRTRPRRRS